VLVEVFDGVVVVGVWALHELIEVVWKALLGLLARVISRGDQRGVGQSAVLFFCSFSPSAWRGPHPNLGAWPCLCVGLCWSTVGVALARGVGQSSMVLGRQR